MKKTPRIWVLILQSLSFLGTLALLPSTGLRGRLWLVSDFLYFLGLSMFIVAIVFACRRRYDEAFWTLMDSAALCLGALVGDYYIWSPLSFMLS